MSEAYTPNPYRQLYRVFLENEGSGINTAELATALRKDGVITTQQDKLCRTGETAAQRQQALFMDVLAPMGLNGVQNVVQTLRKLNFKNWNLYFETANALEKMVKTRNAYVDLQAQEYEEDREPHAQVREKQHESVTSHEKIAKAETQGPVAQSVIQTGIGHTVNMGDVGKILDDFLPKSKSTPPETSVNSDEPSPLGAETDGPAQGNSSADNSMSAPAGVNLSIGNTVIGGGGSGSGGSGGIVAKAGVDINIGNRVEEGIVGSSGEIPSDSGDTLIQQDNIHHDVNLEDVSPLGSVDPDKKVESGPSGDVENQNREPVQQGVNETPNTVAPPMPIVPGQGIEYK